ncbi:MULTISPECIES: iron-containing alcohol dehydrogenase [unclassified Sinorhizobium]|uniref:iron-containing alcohol dehydrogenase n=1 Tax=unclassified Sinorhizobium TaxID=2613772 RepID=UPI0024C23CBA|nr:MULTISPECIES: iron-containing alcohol dehydrogenase [unclassified Sinorhizobium]MDK1373766.1 iron-containing alcohol dehydrogenase [Sinorhizobium sp. 6-70]MDK1478733.1 iron-containing alcohol dehydrogenase [Sinorhizobium sp. 6-117]
MNELRLLPQDVVCWGHGILPSALASLNNRGVQSPILFSIPELADIIEARIRPALPVSSGRYLDFPPHVPDIAVEAALDAVRQCQAKSIIALGGGSVLDAAKAVSHMHFLRFGSYLPIAALPTTLSGSEFSHFFGITETNREDKFKRSYAVRETTPKMVILDPMLIVGTPRSLLLSSAIKGLDHAIEGMRKIDPDHPHAIIAARGVSRFLAILRRWPKDATTAEALASGSVSMEDLLQLQLSAWHCYFYPASVVYGLSHRIGHILGGTFGLPHSMTSCITLAPVIGACAEYYGDKLDGFTQLSNNHSTAESLSEAIASVVRHLGLPSRIGDFGLESCALPKVVAMLQEHYREEVGDLGDQAESKLFRLLENMW